MIEKYNDMFDDYKEFITSASQCEPRVVKTYTSTSTYFPIIAFQLSNITDTNECSIDMIERHTELYLTIDIYSKDKMIGNNKIASQLINDEITELTLKYLEKKKLKVTLCILTPNADTSITRRTIQCQGLISMTRGNIIRR